MREIDATWNSAYDSILLMYQKLKDIGFVYCNDEVVLRTPKLEHGDE